MTYFTVCAEIEETSMKSLKYYTRGDIKAKFYVGEGRKGVITLEFNGYHDFTVGKEYTIEIKETEIKTIEQ